MMNALIAIASFALTWFVARFVLVRYLQYRRRTVAGREWQEYKARLPGWVKQVEMLVQAVLWLLIALLLVSALLGIHSTLRPDTHGTKGLWFGLILFPSLFAAIVPAMLLANFISWLIPPLKAANLAAFDGFQATSFQSANVGLLKLGAILSPICVVIGLLGAYEPWMR
jgi:hypothetical protein